MGVGAKITKVLGGNKYEVEIDPVDTNTHQMGIGIAHDYVQFSTWSHIFTKQGLSLNNSNILPIEVSVQIPIKVMGQVGLPLMNSSAYLKSEHFDNYGIYRSKVIRTWDKTEGYIVYVYNETTKNFTAMPESLYKQLTNTKNEQED